MDWSNNPHPRLLPIKGEGIRRAAILFGICVLGFGLFHPQVVHADPHAIFYTQIGQQQLFFNVLAALDQADYVEIQKNREDLVSERAGITANPPFEENFSLVDATQASSSVKNSEAGVSDLLARLITLEGNDLYTDELVRQVGVEFARRNGTSELIRALCSYGLGLIDCEFVDKDPGESVASLQKRSTSQVVDALGFAERPIRDGVIAALNSGASAADSKFRDPTNGNAPISDRDYRQKVMLGEPGLERVPLAYSADIDAWRQYIDGLPDGDNKKGHKNKLDGLLVAVAGEYGAPPHEWPFANLEFEKDGKPILKEDLEPKHDADDGGGSNPNRKIRAKADLIEEAGTDVLFAQMTIRSIARAAYERIKSQWDLAEEQGLLAEYTLKNDPPPNTSDRVCNASTCQPYVNDDYKPSSYDGEISMLIRNPVAVRAANVYSLPTILGLADTSQQFSALIGIDTPGAKQLVQRSGGTQTGDTEPDLVCDDGFPPTGDNGLCSDGKSPGRELGATTGGEVLGDLDLFNRENRASNLFSYDKPRDPTSPAANLVVPHLEQGMVQALRVLTGGQWRPSKIPECGFTCQ